MNAINERQPQFARYALLAVPAAAIAGVLLLAFVRPAVARLRSAERQWSAAAASPADLVRRRETLRSLQAQFDAERVGVPVPLAAATSQPGSARPSEADTLRRASRLISDRRILIVSATRLGEAEQSAALGTDLRTRLAGLAGSDEAAARIGAVWKLELEGPFADMRAALRALAANDNPAVCVGLAMAPAAPSPDKRSTLSWTLWLWIPSGSVQP